MCTLTFVPTSSGYCVAMNRDEALVRPPAEPPRTCRLDGVAAVFPQERAAGTWIAGNDFGVCLALLNWDRPKVTPPLHTRGQVIPNLIRNSALGDVQRALAELNLQGTWPFRLMGFFPGERSAQEWRWDGAALSNEPHGWTHQHWFSSGMSDEEALRKRSKICAEAWQEPDAGSLRWMRRLHLNHGAAAGPFSICVHRDEAATLSYTEVEVTSSELVMRYRPGQPCGFASRPGWFETVSLPLHHGIPKDSE